MKSDWQSCIIGDLLETIIDYRGKTPPKSKNGIPTITAANVKGGRIDLSRVSYVSKETYDQWTTRGFPESGDVIITTEAPVGEVAPFPSNQTYLITRRVMALRGKKGVLDNDFLLYVLQSPIYKNKLLTKIRGSTVSRVLKTDITELEIALPSINEQKKIAGVLKTIDNKIELNRQINQTLESMAQAIFKSWFVNFEPVKSKIAAIEAGEDSEGVTRAVMRAISGKTDDELDQMQAGQPENYARLKTTAELFPAAMQDSELGEVPEGWEVKSLDQIGHYQNGLALQKFRPKDGEMYLPVLKIAQLKKGFADKDEKASVNIKPKCVVENGDVVFSWSGSLMVDIWCGGKVALNQHLFKVTSEKYSKWFYYYWTKHHLSGFQRIAAAKAVTMGHIKREHLSSALCVTPCSQILKKVPKTIEYLIEKTIDVRLENVMLQDLRDTLLPKLLSGELSVDAIEMARGKMNE